MCQLAVPLILPKNDVLMGCQKSTFLSWPLQATVKSWGQEGSDDFCENNIVNVEMPIVSFIRLGTFTKSKSKVLNQLLSSPYHQHSYFWHEELTGGEDSPVLSEGLVELCWYLPRGDRYDVFPKPVAFANTRGDGLCKDSTSTFMAQNSSLTCIFVEQMTQDTLDFISNYNVKNIFLVLVYSKDHDVDLSRLIENTGLREKQLISLSREKYASRKITSRIRTTILEKIQGNTMLVSTIETLKDAALGCNIDVDQNKTKCRKAKSICNDIMKNITRRDILKAKQDILPRQGQMWKEWASSDREQYKQEGRKKKEPVDTYIRKKQEEKKRCREEQWQKTAAPELTLFLQHLLTLDKETRRYFLKWFQIGLDSHSREQLRKIRKEYNGLLDADLSTVRAKKLKQLDIQLQEGSLGLEHFFREFGQIYEASVDLKDSEGESDFINKLPTIMAELVLEGHPLEIMDGDVVYVPEVWVKAVLKKIQHKKTSPLKIYLISTLGVQSSGKSTLLNTMFNLRFPVSSGRCTRGAFLQLIKVPDGEMDFDFIGIIDTEGLKSPEMMSLLRSYEHENELATLVIGLSDVTLVNLAMQSIADMKDTLQVAVHAFLRMKCVGQNQACYFVHQNVAAIGVSYENIQAHQNLLKQLDAMTFRASEMEGLQNTYRTFSDILQYDHLEHCFYIPGLWMGNPPMASTNLGYSTEVARVREALLQHGSSAAEQKEFFTFQSFGRRLHDLWQAMKYEDFVFSFQNCLTADAYAKLKKTFSELKHAAMTRVHEWKNRMKIQIECTSLDMLETFLKSMTRKAQMMIHEEKLKMKKTIDGALNKSDHRDFVLGYKADILSEIDSFCCSLQKNVLTTMAHEADLKKVHAKLNDQQKEIEEAIRKEVQKFLTTKEFANIQKDQCLSADQKLDMKKHFDSIWKRSFADVDMQALNVTENVDIDTDVYEWLCDYFKDQKYMITKTMMNGDDITRLSELDGRFEATADLLEVKDDVVMLDDPQPGDRRDITKSDLQKANQAARKIIDLCLVAVRRKTIKPGPYETQFANDVIKLVHDQVNKLHDDCFQYTTAFKVELAIRITASATRAFIKAHKKFTEEDHPIKKVEAAKENYIQLFETLILQTGHAEIFCNNFLSAALLSNVRRTMDSTNLANEVRAVRGQSLRSHEFLQLGLMIELLQKDSFKEYWSYINNYQIYVQKWLKKETLAVFNKIYPYASRSRLAEIAIRALETLLDYVEVSLLEAQTRSSDNFAKFLSEFINILQMDKAVMMFDMAEVDRYQAMLKINDIDNFVKASREILHNDLRRSLTSKITDWDVSVELDRLVPSVEDILFDLIVGCDACCPFCKAPCDCHNLAKIGDHSVTIHRPRGLMGAIWAESKTLIAETCPYLVNSKTNFQNDETQGEWVPYRKYKSYYPDWLIKPSADSSTALYWKWVFARFQEHFAKCHGVQPNISDVPAEWYSISREHLEQDLSMLYNTTITTELQYV